MSTVTAVEALGSDGAEMLIHEACAGKDIVAATASGEECEEAGDLAARLSRDCSCAPCVVVAEETARNPPAAIIIPPAAAAPDTWPGDRSVESCDGVFESSGR
jgi:hypothetical protein